MATPYSLGSVLNRPVGESVTADVTVGGQTIHVNAVNLDDFVELTISGEAILSELCARCNAEVSLQLPFQTTVKVKDKATDDELEDGVVVLDRHSQVDLDQLVGEAVELARPTITYCPKHQTASPKPFIIE